MSGPCFSVFWHLKYNIVIRPVLHSTGQSSWELWQVSFHMCYFSISKKDVVPLHNGMKIVIMSYLETPHVRESRYSTHEVELIY